MSEWAEHRTPVARKEHCCDWCAGKIKVGEKYSYDFCFDEAVATHLHTECLQALYRELSASGESEIELIETYPRGLTIEEFDALPDREVKADE